MDRLEWKKLIKDNWKLQSDPEELMHALADLVDEESKLDMHQLQKGCLEGCSEHLRDAAMAYYASTK